MSSFSKKKKSEIAKMFGFDAFISYVGPGTIIAHVKKHDRRYVSSLIAGKEKTSTLWNPYSPYLSMIDNNNFDFYVACIYYYLDIKLIDEVSFHFSHNSPSGHIETSYPKANKEYFSVTNMSSNFMLYYFLKILKENKNLKGENEFLPRFYFPLDPYLRKIKFLKSEDGPFKGRSKKTRVPLDGLDSEILDYENFRDFITENFEEFIFSY